MCNSSEHKNPSATGVFTFEFDSKSYSAKATLALNQADPIEIWGPTKACGADMSKLDFAVALGGMSDPNGSLVLGDQRSKDQSGYSIDLNTTTNTFECSSFVEGKTTGDIWLDLKNCKWMSLPR